MQYMADVQSLPNGLIDVVQIVPVISKSLADAEAEYGITFTIGGVTSNCADFSPFSQSGCKAADNKC